MALNERNSKRVRVTVPNDDVEVLQWLSSQHAMSVSVRELIHDAILEHGIQDYFVATRGQVQKPSRGRPMKPLVDMPTDIWTPPNEEIEVQKLENEEPAELVVPKEDTPVVSETKNQDARERILAMQGLLNK